MRLSFEQARALNIDEAILQEAEEYNARSYSEEIRAQADRSEVEPTKPKRTKPDDGYDSKLERDFAECLKRAEREQWIRQWWHHPWRFRLAPKCYYQPDFMVDPCRYTDYDPNRGFTSRDDKRLIFIEIKGGWFRDDAKVKTKVVAEKFPCFRWLLVTREKRNGWDAREVDHRGISREPIQVPWIQ